MTPCREWSRKENMAKPKPHTAEAEVEAITEALVPPPIPETDSTQQEAERSVMNSIAGVSPDTVAKLESRLAPEASSKLEERLAWTKADALLQEMSSQQKSGFSQAGMIGAAAVHQVPTIGRIVHFYDTWKPGAIRAAIVVGTMGNIVDLVVFDPTQNPVSVLYTQIPYDKLGEKKLGTWAWPERI